MVIIVPYYTHKPGGMCKRLYRLMNALVKRDHSVHYFTLDNPPPELKNNVKIEIIPFFMKERAGIKFWSIFTLWLPIYLLIRGLPLKPSRIIIFNPYYTLLSKPLSLLSGAKIYLYLRSRIAKTAVIIGQPAVYRIAGLISESTGIFLANKVICTTAAMQKQLGLDGKKKVLILANDLPEIKNIDVTTPTHPFRIFTSGNLYKIKNISLLLDAVAMVNQQVKDVELIIAGDGEDRAQLESQRDYLGISNVRFLGWIDNNVEIAASASLIVHPSLIEGMSNSILEALALKKVVIASYIPEIRELLKYDDLLFDPHNPSALAAKIIKLIRSPEALKKLEALCAERAAAYSFDWDKKASEILEDGALKV